ncbi:MAG TPA: hypothetical protein VIT68_04520 [Candidatus Gracilibacteria bacterium]
MEDQIYAFCLDLEVGDQGSGGEVETEESLQDTVSVHFENHWSQSGTPNQQVELVILPFPDSGSIAA